MGVLMSEKEYIQFQDPTEQKIYEINQMLMHILTRQNDIFEEILKIINNMSETVDVLVNFAEQLNEIKQAMHVTKDDGK